MSKLPATRQLPVPVVSRRSVGSRTVARALWYVGPGLAELRPAALPLLPPGWARVQTAYSAISRGTERLVWQGRVPVGEYERMRAPLQEGAFPFPVKYGYAATGRVVEGPETLLGKGVFCLHPHQDVFQVPAEMLTPLQDGIPLKRATLAANMETALNALWDAGAGPGDSIVVVGAGIVGLLIAALAARLPGATVRVVDPAADRGALVKAMGCQFVPAATLQSDADVVFHTSASQAGLETALSACGIEATLLELSWYGDKPVSVVLGGTFHSRRLKLISSQVGQVAASRRPRWSHKRRLEKALDLLQDPIFDRLVEPEFEFMNLVCELSAIFDAGRPALPPVICYPT